MRAVVLLAGLCLAFPALSGELANPCSAFAGYQCMFHMEWDRPNGISTGVGEYKDHDECYKSLEANPGEWHYCSTDGPCDPSATVGVHSRDNDVEGRALCLGPDETPCTGNPGCGVKDDGPDSDVARCRGRIAETGAAGVLRISCRVP